MISNDTICAISTAHGNGAIAIVRLSGAKAISIIDQVFLNKKNQKIVDMAPNTIHFGKISDENQILDEVLVSVFKNPNSYTGEDLIEVSCHGSIYIQQQILQIFVRKGARLAKPGEFTMRAFLNGKLDLSQAEAVADLIASSSKAQHKLAMSQMRGGFSSEIGELRNRLLKLISLIELELDFSEEDVEFADRNELKKIVLDIEKVTRKLSDSFNLGNAIKNGIPITIAGKTNVGKSTLLNALLNEDKAIVSDIAGTTRDVIEDTIAIDGIVYRFIDTAGIRESEDTIERIGIERTQQKIEQARVVLYMVDAEEEKSDIVEELNAIMDNKNGLERNFILVINKIDKLEPYEINYKFSSVWMKSVSVPVVLLSASKKDNINKLMEELSEQVNSKQYMESDIIISNVRHYEALLLINQGIDRIKKGLIDGISSEFIAMDIRQILHYLGEITGEITTDEVLGNIFKNFCIGK